ATEVVRDLTEFCAILAGEAVAQFAAVVPRVGVIKPGLAFQYRFAARRTMSGNSDGKQSVAYRTALPQRATAAPGPFEIAGREVNALRNRAVQLVLVEALNLRGGDRGAKNAEHRPCMKAARHNRRDELGGHPLHDLIAGRHRGQEEAPRAAGALRR